MTRFGGRNSKYIRRQQKKRHRLVTAGASPSVSSGDSPAGQSAEDKLIIKISEHLRSLSAGAANVFIARIKSKLRKKALGAVGLG